jgi:CHASE2 domain-containing sensor protein/signal transduction histidine kinase
VSPAPTAADRLRPRWRAVRAQWLLLLVVLLATLAALQASDLFWRIDHAIYDAAMRGQPAPDDIVIVAIDDASVAALGRWPWRRAVHAALLARLRAAGVRGVALDLIFTEPELPATGGDAALAAAMTAGPPTVLPLLAARAPTRRGAMREQRPIAPLERAAAALGHAHVEIDRDGIARSVFLREGPGTPRHAHFALALLERVDPAQLAPLRGLRHPNLAGAARDAWVRDYRMLIPFLGPPGHFTTVSYVDVLRGAVDAGRLRGRWVLVGATAQGLGDAYATPLSRGGLTTPGVELGANVLQALRDGSGIVPAGAPARLLLGALPLLAAFAGFLALSPRRSLLLLAAAWIATLGASAMLLHFHHWWWPPAAALAVLTAAYPLWNWRRLEATQRFLDEEFTRLMAERTPLAREPAPSLAAPAAGGDPLQRRIELVDAAATRLRDLRRLLSDTIANLPDAALVVDRDARIVLANPAAGALFGAASPVAAAAPGGPAAVADPAPLIDAALAPRLDATFGAGAIDLATVLGTQSCVQEARTRGPGRARDLLLRAAPFHDDAGTRLGTILSLADVTGLRDLQRERDDLVGFLSHDIRSPVTALLALAQLQRDPRRALPPEQFAQRAESLAQRSLELAEGFVALARAEALEPATFEPFDLRDAVQDAVDETWATAEWREVALGFVPGDARWPILGHRGLLARAVANLVGNAVKFTPAGGRVRVEGGAVGDQWEVRVTDTGPGIDPALRARLFGRFERGTTPATREAGGSGLGLAFVRVVAERHRGRIGLRDATRGGGDGHDTGSEFFLRLPRYDAPAA